MIREMFLYPWDVWDEPEGKTADELREMGVSHVSVAALYHQARMLFPHRSSGKLKMHQGGSLYVPFDGKRYSELAPRQGQGMPSGGWRKMISELKDRGITVSAWSVLLHNSFLAARYPRYAIENVYGDRIPSNLCPSNAAVRDYLAQIIRDIAASGVNGIDAESLDFAGFLHGDHHEMQAYADTAQLNRLLGLCFCPACLADARARGIDAEELRRQVRRAAEAFLNLKPIPCIDPDLLQAYDRMRCDRISGLYKDLQEIGKVPLRPVLWAAGDALPVEAGVRAREIGVQEIIACYPESPRNVSAFAERIRSETGGDKAITGGIRLMAPQCTAAEQVREYETAYCEAGIEKVIYYQYGMAPQPFLDELKRA